MLTNIPSAEGLNETALRLHFDAWKRSLSIITDFCEAYAIEEFPKDSGHEYKDEWDNYISGAQSEIGAICTTAQQSAELRLKSIICETSPFLLLLNGNVNFKKKDIDFSEMRTLDAVDLPDAVRSMTNFPLADPYPHEYAKMRKLRNKITHLGSHDGNITPDDMIMALSRQYVILWPDGRWLYRRTRFDGNSARIFFHDNRYSCSESDVMAELPLTMSVMGNQIFNKSFGFSKGKLKGFCPSCMSARARKWDADGHSTAYQTSSSSARCAMCEREITLVTGPTSCPECRAKTSATISAEPDNICFKCGK